MRVISVAILLTGCGLTNSSRTSSNQSTLENDGQIQKEIITEVDSCKPFHFKIKDIFLEDVGQSKTPCTEGSDCAALRTNNYRDLLKNSEKCSQESSDVSKYISLQLTEFRAALAKDPPSPRNAGKFDATPKSLNVFEDGSIFPKATQGDDWLYGQEGFTTIDGLGGNDRIWAYWDASSTLYGGEGDDYLTGADHNDRLYGGSGRDNMDGKGGNDILNGGDGDDILVGGPGEDVLVGGNGNDALVGNEIWDSTESNTYDGGNGDDSYQGNAASESFIDTNGNNFASTGLGNDTVVFGDGENRVQGLDGNKSITVGNGDNSMHLANGNNTISGGNGTNYVSFENGNTSVVLGGGDNYVSGYDGIMTLTAGNGENVASFLDGKHTITFGNGVSNIFVGRGYSNITLGNGKNQISKRGLSAADKMSLSSGDGGNLSTSGAGDDHITTGNGFDVIYAGDGNNYIHSGDGKARILTGNGKDGIYTGDGAARVFAGPGDDSIYLGDSGYWFTGIINIELHGDPGDANFAYGQEGDDFIVGGDHIDYIYGGSGNDTLYGGGDPDNLNGGSGNDKLYGDAGTDTLSGGDGDDEYWGGSGADFYFNLSGDDKVHDLGPMERIGLSGFGYRDFDPEHEIMFRNDDYPTNENPTSGEVQSWVRDWENWTGIVQNPLPSPTAMPNQSPTPTPTVAPTQRTRISPPLSREALNEKYAWLPDSLQISRQGNDLWLGKIGHSFLLKNYFALLSKGVISGVTLDIGASTKINLDDFAIGRLVVATGRVQLLSLLNLPAVDQIVKTGPGDFDFNGLVDQADRAVWISAHGKTDIHSLLADGNGDGYIDVADYTVWRDNLGKDYRK